MAEQEITKLLELAAAGDRSALEEVIVATFADLRMRARSELKRNAPWHTIEPTAIVDQVYGKLSSPSGEWRSWSNRAHFFGAAAKAVRELVVDYARSGGALKRGRDHKRVDMAPDHVHALNMNCDEVLAIHEVLEQYESEHPDRARVVYLRYFAGLTIEETASVLDCSMRTVANYWEHARAWLFDKLGGTP